MNIRGNPLKKNKSQFIKEQNNKSKLPKNRSKYGDK